MIRFFCHGVLDDISAADIPLLVRGAALHDIGKLWIPAEIINKSGSLTPEETALMKKHTLLGAVFDHEIRHIVHAVYFPNHFWEQDETMFLRPPQKAGISHAGA